MVVVAAMLVVSDEQCRVLPRRRAHQPPHDRRDELLADLDVLWVLLRRGGVVGIDEGELREPPGRDVGEELIEPPDARGAPRGVRARDDQKTRDLLVVDRPVDAVSVEPINVACRTTRRSSVVGDGDTVRSTCPPLNSPVTVWVCVPSWNEKLLLESTVMIPVRGWKVPVALIEVPMRGGSPKGWLVN